MDLIHQIVPIHSRTPAINTYLRPKAEFKLQSSRHLVTSQALWQRRAEAEVETRDQKSQGQSQCNELAESRTGNRRQAARDFRFLGIQCLSNFLSKQGDGRRQWKKLREALNEC
nr:hypothetical protein Iba_chr12eCG6690 [Ipomoea batatas]